LADRKHNAKDLRKKASGIRGIICDVDGVLTNGKFHYDQQGKESKHFYARDGVIVSHLKKAGIIAGVVSSRESDVVSRWCADLKMDFCHQGILDKVSAVQKLASHYKLKLKEVAFIGDDLNDLAVFRIVGMSVCPADALDYIKNEADLVTRVKGGNGVFREVADLVLSAKGALEKIVKGS
jgi:3-deoxy-D-manno-octulosonate 8-phosphate phosphatase (KDO 8-P phosphatase)